MPPVLQRPYKVVFACVHNAGRSQMAAALFNQLADPAVVRAVSAGTNPGVRIHPGVVTALRELKIDLSNERPRMFTDEVGYQAVMMVTMGCGEECPLVPGARVLDWPIEDPADKDLETVRRIRDEIQARVKELVEAEGWGREPAQ